LHLEDVQATGARRIDLLGGLATGIAVAVPPADALIAARTERPAAVLRAGTVTGEDDRGDVRAHARMIEGAVQLVHRGRPERVAPLGPVEGDGHDWQVALAVAGAVDGPVVGEVGGGEAGDIAPPRGVEQVRDLGRKLTHVPHSRTRASA